MARYEELNEELGVRTTGGMALETEEYL